MGVRHLAGGWLAGTLLLTLPLAAQGAASPPPRDRASREVSDETGRRLRVPARIERIISLAPSLTETIFALGLGERLVGVTHQCDFSPAARAKPKVGDVINPNLERIIELQPDVVLGTTVGNRRETVEALEHLGVPLYGVDPHTVEDILASIQHLGELLGVPERGQALARRLTARLEMLEERLAERPRPRVLFLVWLEPVITSGANTFLDDLLRRAGAESITTTQPESWPRLSLEEIIERDPDFLVVPRTPELTARLPQLLQRQPWKTLRAVQQNRLVWVDGAIERPGPGLVELIEQLARALHPEAFAAPPVVRK